MKNLLANWKTTSAGLLLIGGSVIHLVFAVRAGKADEATWTVTLTGVTGGIGLIFAGDATASVPKSEASSSDAQPTQPKP